MRWFKPILLLTVASSLLIAACGTPPSAIEKGIADSSSQLPLQNAQEVAGQFFSAWESSDYAAMYTLISPNSKALHAQDDFEDQYQIVSDQMRLDSVESQILDSSRQGTTAIITYETVFHSKTFGDIVEPGRMMRLIETPAGWRIHWSTMDIVSGMADGTRLELVRTIPVRGNIYDRNGDVLVEENGHSVLLYMTQNGISDYRGCLDELSRILRRERSSLEAQLALFLPETLFLLDEISIDTYQVEAQNLSTRCGIGRDRELPTRTNRLYVGDLAPHVTGYVGTIPQEQLAAYEIQGYPVDAVVGLEGIEATYEPQLAGKIGNKLILIAPTGEVLRTIAETSSEPGQSVYLTIDRDLQASVQQALVEAYDLAQPTWAPQSPGASAMVMDIHTGEILAMASYPWFDPEAFNPTSLSAQSGITASSFNSDPRRPLLNRAMQGLYPAGSVFKIISMAAGLDSGVFATDTPVECANRWNGQQYGDVLEYRTDWYLPGRGLINFSQALTYSCNPYFWQLGVALHNTDPALLTRYANLMGLGVPTGQNVLPEATGKVPGPGNDLQSWEIADTLNLVIGQGRTQITPLQITRMIAAIANGGQLLAPQFVQYVESSGGSAAFEPSVPNTLDFQPATFEAIRQAMCSVTQDPEGTARFIFEEWYKFQGDAIAVCGKTGTAQSGDDNAPPHAWFAAFAPGDRPEIAVVVMVEESCEGSEVAAPIVRRIIEDYYDMPHSAWPPLWTEGCTSIGE